MSLWIDNTADFAAFCQEASTQPRVAVDTEFMWSSTFYPRLALVQLSWGKDHCAVVDPLQMDDCSAFRALLENPAVQKVFHEATSDLPILRRWCHGGLPKNIFDTRLAGAFCGLTQGCSLQKLLEMFFAFTLDKSETRSDWLQRPLSDRQLEYASADVKWLPELARLLQDKISALGNLPWFLEEMELFSQEEFYAEEPPEQYYRSVKGSGRLDRQRLAVLRELATWREKTARALDKTRNRVMSDQQMLDAVALLPENLSQLRQVQNFWPKMIKNYGNDVLQAIRRGLSIPREHCPTQAVMKMPVAVHKVRVGRLQHYVQKRCELRQIDPTLVASRREISALVLAADARQWPIDSVLLRGWRAELLGEELQNLVRSNFTP